jgi:hypothetical protein
MVIVRGNQMGEGELLALFLANAPNYIGLIVLAVILRQILNRMIDIVERCMDDD